MTAYIRLPWPDSETEVQITYVGDGYAGSLAYSPAPDMAVMVIRDGVIPLDDDPEVVAILHDLTTPDYQDRLKTLRYALRAAAEGRPDRLRAYQQAGVWPPVKVAWPWV